MRSINLSASSIKDFVLCSQRYYFRVNSPESSIPTVPMKVGTLVHQVMENASFLTEEGLMTDCLDKLADLKLEKKDYKFALNKITESIKNYSKSFTSLVQDSDLVETNFRIPIGTNSNLVGRIDRLNVESGYVIDWKTSANDPMSLDKDVQFLLYKHAYKHLYGKNPNVVLYANLFTGRLLSLIDAFDYNYNILLDETIPTIIARIKDGDIVKEGIKKKGACKYCPFREKCLGKEE